MRARHRKILFLFPHPQSLRGLLFALLVCGDSSAAAFASPIDSADLAVRNAYPLPVQWENVEGAPYWVAGPLPHYKRKARLHRVRLEPGEDVIIKLPPHEMLQARYHRRPLQADDLEFWMSDGSGLYVQGPPQSSSDGRSFLLAPQRSETMLVRVRRPLHQHQGITLALFVSRHEELPSIMPYRIEIPFSHAPVRIRRTTEAVGRQFWLLTSAAPQTVTVHGPAHLSVETVLPYPPTEAQTLQSYDLLLRVNHEPVRPVEFQTTSERKSRLFIDDREYAVAERTSAYVDIPAGEHHLLFTPTVAVYVRLLQEDQNAYLLPQFNQPTAKPTNETVAGAVASRVEKAGQLGQNNRLRDSGVLATAQLQAVANEYPHFSPLQRVAGLAQNADTFYRDLLSIEKSSTSPQRYGWFLPRSLLAPFETRQELVVAAQHTRDIRHRLANAPFLTLPSTPETPLVYKVPPRSAPAQLRLIVENNSLMRPQTLTIQFNQQERVQVLVVRGPELPESAYATSYLEAGLQAFVWQRWAATPAMSLAVAQALWLPQPLLQVGIIELPLPAEVNEVRVWQTGPATTPVQVALQYTGTKPYRMTELEYLGVVSRLGNEQTVTDQFIAALHNAPRRASDEQHVEQKLENFWVPLVRFLLSQQKTFVSPVAPLPRIETSTMPPLAEAEQLKLVQKAQELEKTGQWLAALERWAQLVYTGTGEYRRHGLWGRVRALRALGETFLAEQQLRGLVLYGGDEAIRRTASEQLRQFYISTEDTDALLAFAAFQTLRSPTVTTLRQLTEVLLTAGEHEMALMVGMALPLAERPVPLLLRAAYRLDWWATFDLFVAQLPREGDRWYWQAYRAIAQGDYRQAYEHLERAGSDWGLFAQALTTGQAVAAKLSAQDRAARAQALFAWEHWQAQLPGPRLWNSDDTIVTDYQGAIRLYSIDRDLYAQFYAATPQRPVQLQVLGPVRLKVEVRPLHPVGTTTPLEDWLQIRAPGQLYETPITNNLPTFGLQVIEETAVLPGRAVTTEIALGPGLQTITLSARQTRVALRVYTQQPELALEVLPPLSPHTLTAIWQAAEERDEPHNVHPHQTNGWTDIRLLTTDHKSSLLTFSPLCSSLGPMPEIQHPIAEVDPVTAVRLALRFGEWENASATFFHERVSTRAELRPEEQVLADAISGTGEKHCVRWLEDDVPVAPALRHAVCFAEGEGDRLLQLPLEQDDEAVRERMLLLLKLATDNPSHRQRMQVLGEALFAAHPQVVGLATLHAQLTRDKTWEPIPAVQTSAGLRAIPMSGWKPESPSIRTRRALVPPLTPGEYVVFGQERLGISLSTLAPTTLLLDVVPEDVEYLPPIPLTAFAQMDQQPRQPLLLSRDAPPTSLQFHIPSGTHTVRVWIERAVVNQFLRVRVREQRPTMSGAVPVSPSAVVMTYERNYHVATAQEPLRFTVAGPQWLRIDEWRQDIVHSRSQFVAEGWQTITLQPQTGQTEALFRVFQSTRTEERIPSALRIVKPESHSVPFPVSDFRAPIRPRVMALADAHRLGRQEDGTWSLMTQFVRQRNFDEDTSVDRVPMEQFLETRATHRFFHQEPGESYSETHLFTRVREHGGPTLGGAERLRFDLNWQDWRPLTLQMSGEGYVQWPGGGRPLSRGGLEWSGLFRWEVSQVRRLTPTLDHRPSVALFARALSLRRRGQYRLGYVDQDIFTNYKADHRAGLTLAESLSYRPWLDSEWTTRLALTSNEEMVLEVPDSLILASTWKQLLRDTQVDGGYSFRTFFADSDRRTTSFRHVLAFDVLQDYWYSDVRLEVGLSFRHDIIRSDNTFNIFFTWHIDHGRGYRDFRPGVIDFLNLRRWRATERPTNRETPAL